MIIKFTVSSAMPTVKRCNRTSDDDDDGDDGDDGVRRSRPMQKLRRGRASNDVRSAGLASSSDDASCSGEFRSSVDHQPLTRTSRGRVQVIPKRLTDSVPTGYRGKEGPDSKTLGGSLLEVKGEDFSSLRPNAGNEKEKQEDKPCRTSWSTMTRKGNCNVDKQQCQDRRFEEEEVKKKFVAGDVVWAQLGSKQLAWPAVVVDPIQQDSGSDLDLCVPGTTLVLFFGRLGGGDKRVFNS